MIESGSNTDSGSNVIMSLVGNFIYKRKPYGFTLFPDLLPDRGYNYTSAHDFVFKKFDGDGVKSRFNSAAPVDIYGLGAERPIAVTSDYASPKIRVLEADDPVARQLEPRLGVLLLEYLKDEGLVS